MADQRDGGIAWTDQTWNPVRGCSRVSPGCENCYAERTAARRRPRPSDMRRVVRAFGLVGVVYDEDNHHPGNARHLALLPSAMTPAELAELDRPPGREGGRWPVSRCPSGDDAFACVGCGLLPKIRTVRAGGAL